MNAFEIGAVLVQALGWCLVHFFWQAILVGAAYALARWLLPRGNPRYIAAMLALVAMAVIPVWTLWHEVAVFTRQIDLGSMLVSGIATAQFAAAVPMQGGWLALLRVALPWLVLAWGCGVALLGIRVVRQWLGLRAIVRAAEALPAWQLRATLFGLRLGLGRAVRVLASVRIATPTLVGWVRPSVVMPLAMLANMPAEQVDLILAHELAHLRRFDHIANLFQVVLETLLFYHPVVHWISREARNEREVCCDALALRATGGKRRDFVAALATLGEFRSDHADLALAASGGVLAERAWFIAGTAAPRRKSAHSHIGAMLLGLLGIAVVLGVSWRYEAAQQASHAVTSSVPPPVSVQVPALALTGITRLSISAPSLRLQPVVGNPVVAPVASSVSGPAIELAAPKIHVVEDMKIARLSIPMTTLVSPVQIHASTQLAASATALPKPVRVVAPVYPHQALASGTRGRVVISFSLDAQGRPRDLAVVSAVPSGVFNRAALLAVQQWRFQSPASPGRRYRQAFSFTPDGATGADVLAAQAGCQHTTGTHICRPLSGEVPDLTTLQEAGH